MSKVTAFCEGVRFSLTKLQETTDYSIPSTLIFDRAKTNKRMIKNILLGVKGAHIWVFAILSPAGIVNTDEFQNTDPLWILAADVCNICLNEKLRSDVLIKYVYGTMSYACSPHFLSLPQGCCLPTGYLLLLTGQEGWTEILGRRYGTLDFLKPA